MGDWRETILGPRPQEGTEDHFRIKHWLEMRGRLRSDDYDGDWARAITAFQRRFAERFIKPADAILEQDNDDKDIPEGRGFAVLALDCLLLESLYGYQRGRHTRAGATSEAFERVLLEEPFRGAFEPENRAARFGRAVRNSILHDGETRDGWIVWKSWSTSGPMVEPTNNGVTRVYRDVFHIGVKSYVDAYFVNLCGHDVRGADLRENFKCRVNELCRESQPALVVPRPRVT